MYLCGDSDVLQDTMHGLYKNEFNWWSNRGSFIHNDAAMHAGLSVPPTLVAPLGLPQMAGAVDMPSCCLLLTNMFDMLGDKEPGWEDDIRDDVLEELLAFGDAVHIHVDPLSQVSLSGEYTVLFVIDAAVLAGTRVRQSSQSSSSIFSHQFFGRSFLCWQEDQCHSHS